MGLRATFDPVNKIIDLIEAPTGGFVNVNVQRDLYSAAKKDWKDDLNLNKYAFPFTTFGGNDIGGGKFAGAYFFLRNDVGWRIRPYSADHELTLEGNLFGFDPNTRIFVGAASMDQVVIRLDTSSLTQAIETGGGASAADIADAVWDETLNDHLVAGSAGKALQNVRYPEAKVYCNINAAVQGDGTPDDPFNTWASAYAFCEANGYRTIVLAGHQLTSNLSTGVFFEINDDVYGYTIIAQNPLFLKYSVADIVGGQTESPTFRGQMYFINDHSGIPECYGPMWLYADPFFPAVQPHLPYRGDSFSTENVTFDLDRNVLISDLNIINGCTFDCTNLDNHTVNVFNVRGDALTITNYTSNSSFSNVLIHLDGGSVIVDSSCTTTGGEIKVVGTGELIDNSPAGTNVIDQTNAEFNLDQVL